MLRSITQKIKQWSLYLKVGNNGLVLPVTKQCRAIHSTSSSIGILNELTTARFVTSTTQNGKDGIVSTTHY